MVHEDYGPLVNEYEELYRAGEPHPKKGGGAFPASYDSERLAVLCDQLRAISHDEYRVAMWQRRAWLHRQHRDGDVYDGTDALQWAARQKRLAATVTDLSPRLPAGRRRTRSNTAAS